MKEVVVYVTLLPEGYEKKNLSHMVGEELLRVGLKKEFGKDLKFEPRDKGEHGKPFFTLSPGLHYNITHSGKYVACAFADMPVGLDIQEHRKASYDLMLKRMVKEDEREKILSSPNMLNEFFEQWVLREAFIKMTGEGLARDLRTIDLNECWHTFLPVDEGYSAALFIPEEHTVRWEVVEIDLP